MSQVISKIYMPANAQFVREHMQRSSTDERLGDVGSNWEQRLFRPLKDLACCSLFCVGSSGIPKFITHGLERELPFLYEALFVFVQVHANNQVVSKPTGSLFERPIVVSYCSRDPALSSFREFDLSNEGRILVRLPCGFVKGEFEEVIINRECLLFELLSQVRHLRFQLS